MPCGWVALAWCWPVHLIHPPKRIREKKRRVHTTRLPTAARPPVPARRHITLLFLRVSARTVGSSRSVGRPGAPHIPCAPTGCVLPGAHLSVVRCGGFRVAAALLLSFERLRQAVEHYRTWGVRTHSARRFALPSPQLELSGLKPLSNQYLRVCCQNHCLGCISHVFKHLVWLHMQPPLFSSICLWSFGPLATLVEVFFLFLFDPTQHSGHLVFKNIQSHNNIWI